MQIFSFTIFVHDTECEVYMVIKSISNVNVNFGKKAFTQKGNEYEKSNKCVKVFGSLGVAGAALNLAYPKIMNIATKGSSLEGFSNIVPKKFIAFSALMSLAGGVISGLMCDFLINLRRAEEADKKQP